MSSRSTLICFALTDDAMRVDIDRENVESAQPMSILKSLKCFQHQSSKFDKLQQVVSAGMASMNRQLEDSVPSCVHFFKGDLRIN